MELRDISMAVNAILSTWIMIYLVHRLFKFQGTMHALAMAGLFVALLCFQLWRQTLNWRGDESVLIALGQTAIVIITGYVVSWLRRILEKEEAKKQLAESAKSAD